MVKWSAANITHTHPECGSLTSVDRLVAGQVALVAEGGLAAVTPVGLVAVVLEHVALQGVRLGELGVTLVAEERVAFCTKKKRIVRQLVP